MKGIVLENKILNDKYGIICIKSDEFAQNAAPGQFLMIRPQPYDYIYDPLLRRPLGICDINEKKGTFSLLYMIVGKGTKLLSKIKKKTELSFSEPLGTGFNLTTDKKVAIIGGGVGIAPMTFLSKILHENNEVDVFYGGAEEKDILLTHIFEEYSNNLIIATEDGSIGHKGFITEVFENSLKFNNYDKIFACGPKPMLKAVYDIIDIEKIEFEVSLEERMACGIGACQGCIISTIGTDPNSNSQKRCCVEGPVFNGKEIIWETVCKE